MPPVLSPVLVLLPQGHHVLRVHVSEYTRPSAVVHTAMLLLPSRPTLNPKPSNLNPKLSTLNPTPSTLNEAESQKLKSGEWISMIKAGDARGLSLTACRDVRLIRFKV